MSNHPTNTNLLVAGSWNNTIRTMENRIAKLEAQLAEAQKDAGKWRNYQETKKPGV